MRVLVADTYYPAFLASHYAERPGLERASYDAQLASLIERRFGTGDAYSLGLRAVGCEAWEIIPNNEPLQQAWAREHGPGDSAALRAAIRAPGRLGAVARHVLMRRIFFAQVRALDPEVVYLQDLWFLSRAELDRLRAQGRLVAGQIASEPPPDDILKGFDVIFTSFPHYVERFQALGIGGEYFPIAFDTRVLAEIHERPGGDRPHDVVFVGGVNPRVHPAGTALIERLCEQTALEVWGYGADELPPDSPIRSRHRGEAWGLDMYRVLSKSKIVVNRHIEAAEGHANNMRLFEGTGCGALVLTEEAPNLNELFTPGEEIVTYRDEAHLVELIGHYTAQDDEREAIARAGQRRTLTEHAYERRLGELASRLRAWRRTGTER